MVMGILDQITKVSRGEEQLKTLFGDSRYLQESTGEDGRERDGIIVVSMCLPGIETTSGQLRKKQD